MSVPVTVSSGFTQGSVTFQSVNGSPLIFYKGLAGTTGPCYANDGNTYIFQKVVQQLGDTGPATGSITIDGDATVNYYLVGGGRGGEDVQYHDNEYGGGQGGQGVNGAFDVTSGTIIDISIGTGGPANTAGGATTITVNDWSDYTANGGTTISPTTPNSGSFFTINGKVYCYGGGGGGGSGNNSSFYNGGGGSNSGNGGGGGAYSVSQQGSGGGGGGCYGAAGGSGSSDGTAGAGGGSGPNAGGNGTAGSPGDFFGTNAVGGNGGQGGVGGGGGGAGIGNGQDGFGGAGGVGGGGGGGQGGGNGGINGGGGGQGSFEFASGVGGQGLVVLEIIPRSQPVPCFKEGSKILTDKGYVPIEELVVGDLVKTSLDGYKPINMIGHSKLQHNALSKKIKDQLYILSPEKYPDLVEPLVLTGAHSILENDFVSEEQREKVIELLGKVYITDDKKRIPVCLDERSVVYKEKGCYTIYHLALDNDNYYWNYGIYANGLLVESCSKRYLKELSNMTIRLFHL